MNTAQTIAYEYRQLALAAREKAAKEAPGSAWWGTYIRNAEEYDRIADEMERVAQIPLMVGRLYVVKNSLGGLFDAELLSIKGELLSWRVTQPVTPEWHGYRFTSRVDRVLRQTHPNEALT